jgi:hypothetical protein
MHKQNPLRVANRQNLCVLSKEGPRKWMGEGRAGENGMIRGSDSGGFEPRGKGNWICRGKRLRCTATWVSNGITDAHDSRSKIEIPTPIPIPGLTEGSGCWYFYSCCCCEQLRRRILAEVPPYPMWRSCCYSLAETSLQAPQIISSDVSYASSTRFIPAYPPLGFKKIGLEVDPSWPRYSCPLKIAAQHHCPWAAVSI